MRADSESRKIRMSLKVLIRFHIFLEYIILLFSLLFISRIFQVPEDDHYIFLLEYYNLEPETIPLYLEVRQQDQLLLRENITLKYCPYSSVFDFIEIVFIRLIIKSTAVALSISCG